MVSELYGGPGNDVLVGGLGLNILDGGDGNDQLFGGPGRDLLVGGFGFDTLIGAPATTSKSAMRSCRRKAIHWSRRANTAALNSTNSYTARVGQTFSDLFVRGYQTIPGTYWRVDWGKTGSSAG